LSLEPETAVREYQQLSPLMPPGTLVSYTVRLAPVVDFRAGYDSRRWSDLWEEFHCDWRELWFNQRVEPPSWVLADEALAAGAKGILFASRLATGGTNLVVFNEQLTADASGTQGIASGCRVNGTTKPITAAHAMTIAPQVYSASCNRRTQGDSRRRLRR